MFVQNIQNFSYMRRICIFYEYLSQFLSFTGYLLHPKPWFCTVYPEHALGFSSPAVFV